MLETEDPMSLPLRVLQAYVAAVGGALHVSFVDPNGKEVPLLWTEPTATVE